MSPAPANESATFMSPFFTAPAAAAPLSERDCNGAFACPAVCKAPLAAAPCAMRRGASFLDADDACLAISDKNGFLIPEDSYLPGQENYAAGPCAPATLPALGRVHGPCPSVVTASSAFAAAHTSAASATAAPRSRMTTPCPLLDTPVFGVLAGDEEFAAASVCFEKAVQALEMVERPSGLHEHCGARRQVTAGDQQPLGELGPSAASDGGVAHQTSSTDCDQRQTPDMQQPRRVSSLTPSPPASQLSGGEQLFVVLPYEQAAAAAATVSSSAACDQAYADAAESAAAVGWAAPTVLEPASASAGIAGLGNAAAMAVPSCPGVASVVIGQADDAAVADSAVPAAPAAAAGPPPVVKAFHHKTGGPCDHCGATESPQWRRGPPAKPMLCNACGTRFRRTNQLNPAAALTPSGRAAAAAAAAAVGPAAKRNAAAKRDPPYVASTSSKRARSSAY